MKHVNEYRMRNYYMYIVVDAVGHTKNFINYNRPLHLIYFYKLIWLNTVKVLNITVVFIHILL